MRTLYLHLAILDCWEASWRFAAGDVLSAARFVRQATLCLETSGRMRDGKDAWNPILGTSHVSQAAMGPGSK